MTRLTPFIALAACGGGSATPKLDAQHVPTSDARAPDAAPAADAPSGAYRHTIAIDGSDDFATTELFATTSASFTARIAWDATHLYLGYSGPDLATTTTSASTKWLFAYLDVDPGAGTGATTSQTYNTQHATFPTGFGAEHYLRWKCDGTLFTLETFGGGAWTTSTTVPAAAHAGEYVELAIPLAALGSPATLGIAAWMINEEQTFEGSFAGLYAGDFTDGYAMNLPIAKYLRADFAATRAPNDPANAGP